MYKYHKKYHKSNYFCECENRSLLLKGCRRGQKSVLTALGWASPRQSSETAGYYCYYCSSDHARHSDTVIGAFAALLRGGTPPLLLASGGTGNIREIEENGLMLGMCPKQSTLPWKSASGQETAVCSTQTAFSKPGTLLGKNSASHAAKSLWQRSAISLRLFSQTQFSRISLIFPVTTPPARRRTTLPSSCLTFARTLRVLSITTAK